MTAACFTHDDLSSVRGLDVMSSAMTSGSVVLVQTWRGSIRAEVLPDWSWWWCASPCCSTTCCSLSLVSDKTQTQSDDECLLRLQTPEPHNHGWYQVFIKEVYPWMKPSGLTNKYWGSDVRRQDTSGRVGAEWFRSRAVTQLKPRGPCCPSLLDSARCRFRRGPAQSAPSEPDL